MAVRIALVANTRSGAADSKREVEALLREVGADLVDTDFRLVCEDPQAAAARLDGAERIVVSGGDGSIGPAARVARTADLPLGVVPAGTANSFVRWLGLPLDLREAVALAAHPDPRLRTAELADADGRPFVNVASAGLSVLAGDHARPLKDLLGVLAYAVGAARAAVTGRPLRCRVSVDGQGAWEGDAWQVLVAASGAFGGESSVGGVDPHDRRLDVAIVPAGPRTALARRAWAMRRGRLVHDDAVHHVRGRVVELGVPARTGFNVDGEVLRLVPRFAFEGTFEVAAPPAEPGSRPRS